MQAAGDEPYQGKSRLVKIKRGEGNAKKGRGTWPGMQQDYQTKQKRRKKKNMRQGIVNSQQGTLLGEIKARKTKMSRRRPQARWGLMEEGQDDLPNRRLRFQRK